MMKCALRLLLAAACIIGVLGAQAPAHPHVWATIRSELVYSPDGRLVAIRHAWSFDAMFSAQATQDVRAKQNGLFTREELQPLASLNVTSLKEFDYFTSARVDDESARLADAADYWLEYANSVLTLHFTLPLRKPVKPRTVEIEFRDPSFIVDLVFAEKEPVTLANAPKGCKLAVLRPRDTPGLQGTNRISVSCP